MPHFSISSDKKVLLTTSYKAMFTSVKYSAKAKEISSAHMLAIIINALSKNDDIYHYQIVRNPYERLVSFFYDKLRNALPGDPDREFKLQNSQKLILRKLNINPFLNAHKKADILLNITFDEFIYLLPKLTSNKHLRPQILTAPKIIETIIGSPSILKMEEDLDAICSISGVNRSLKRNPTIHPTYEELFNSSTYKIANEIYYGDFIKYGYQIMH